MSDLTAFRDYCRKQAGPPVAPGCPAAADRALWLQMADEIDAYLAGGQAEYLDLFGDTTREPDVVRALCDPLPDDEDPPIVRTLADPERPA